MASVQEIRALVMGYISGNASASELANSFSPALKSALKSGDPSAQELALGVHSQLAHHFNGFISEASLRSNLSFLAADSVYTPLAAVSIEIPHQNVSQMTAYNDSPIAQLEEVELVISAA